MLPIEKLGTPQVAGTAAHESPAIKLLDPCPNQSEASLLLPTPAPARSPGRATCWSSAVNSEMTRIAHRHRQNLIDLNLHGDVSEHSHILGSVWRPTGSVERQSARPSEPSRAMLPDRMFKTLVPGDEPLLLLHAIRPCILKPAARPQAPREHRVRTHALQHPAACQAAAQDRSHMLYVLRFPHVVGERVALRILWHVGPGVRRGPRKPLLHPR